jgi:ribose 5-phosphate isomerase RpiB
MLAIEEALEIVDLWLTTDFQGGRHKQRIDLIDRQGPSGAAGQAGGKV